MKKLFTLLVAAGVFFSYQASALDLVSSAQKAQEKIDAANQKAEAQKAEFKAKQEKAQAEKEAKKAERKKAIEDTKNSLNNLKDAFAK